ncbi:MAG TPA: hypothetical protein VFS10_10795 [Pyrinomonadaceae bacterium]|nr:hypothetical protein [Pyrinomonadaceae bacterium]
MALDTKRDNNDRTRLVKIKFVRNTTDDGVDYGPDYPKKVAEVPFHRAAGYIRQGRAEAVDKDEELQEVEDSARDAGRLGNEKSASEKDADDKAAGKKPVAKK